MARHLAAGLAACLLFVMPSVINAHPHVFIEQRMDICFDDRGLAGFKVNWTFDEMFSVMIAEDFDTDKNGSLSPEEVAVIREKAFGYIAEYGYYIHISIEGRPFPVTFTTKFNAVLEQGKLRYEFFIPCHVSAVPTTKQIVVSPYDTEYYSDIYFAQKSPVTLVNAGGFEVNHAIKIDKSTSIYFDMVNPWAVFLNFRLK
ncbi:MAG: DUF1007 family protein [Desulfobacter sp.]|nr:MAG: DUF1007 family protein [Desulfobacter sp.]